MSRFELAAMWSRNRIDAGVPFLAIVQGDELVLDAGRVPQTTDDVLDRFSNEGRDPYEEETTAA